jgi:hypothetical protein
MASASDHTVQRHGVAKDRGGHGRGLARTGHVKLYNFAGLERAR